MGCKVKKTARDEVMAVPEYESQSLSVERR